MTQNRFDLRLTSPDHTAALARALAPKLAPGDVILLEGPIGAGKSHFSRSLIQSLQEVVEDVPSPTFTLVQTYEGRSGEIWHSDLYRLSSVDEIEELGLLEAFEDAICLIEWPDRLRELTPPSALHLSLSPDKGQNALEHRLLRATWTDPKWNARLKGLQP